MSRQLGTAVMDFILTHQQRRKGVFTPDETRGFSGHEHRTDGRSPPLQTTFRYPKNLFLQDTLTLWS